MDDAITPVDPKKNNATEARPSRKSQIYKVDVIPQTVSPVPRTEKQVFHVHTKKKKATEAGPSRKSQNYDLYHRDGVETEDIKQRTAIPEKQVFHVHTKRNNPIEAGPSRKSQNPKINVMYQTDSPFPKTGNPKTPLDPNHLSVLNKYNQMDPNKFIQTADLTPMSSNLQRFRFTNEKSRRRSLDSKLKSNPLSTSQVHLKETNSSPATQASLRGFLEDTNKASNLDMEIVSKEPNNVIWLIGSDENPNFDNAYGRRLMEKFFEIAVDSESLLMVHGTKKFCEKIEHLYKHSKLRSGKKKIMGYVTGRLSIQNNFPRIRFTSAAGDQAPIRDKPIFQCVFVFEKGDHQYTKEVEQCTDGVPIVIIQDDTGANRDPSKPKRIYWDLHESHETEEINKLCVVKKIIEAFKVHHNIGDRIPVNLRATWVFLCTSLNYYVKDIERHIKDMLLESNSEENTKRSAMLAISLHRQQFLTELCKNGMSLKAMLSSPGFMSRLYSKASWREYADIKEGRGLQKSHIESNLKRHIELNIGSIDDGVPLEEPELLFITSVLESKLEVSILYWSHVRHPLAAALIAYGIFKAMRNSRSNDQKILKENMVTYRKLAIEATFKGFFSSKTRLFELLAAGIPEWGHLSCIDIALATGNKKFLSKTPTIELRNHIWSKETLSNDALNAGPVSTCIHITPIRIWWFSFISYIILLGLYSFMLLTSLETATFNVLEWFLWFLFLVVVFLKVAILRKRQNMGLSKDNFHVLKSTSLAFFFLAWIFRIAAYCRIDVPELMQFSRVFYSASFILWSLGLLKYCYYFEYLGPIVAMILEMFSTLVKFLVVILICMVAYSVASESVLYPNAEINVKLPFFVLRKSFWSIFGQFFLEEIESIGIPQVLAAC